jgi:hypothetical protein
LLVNFRGAGGSSRCDRTMGICEAEDWGEQNIHGDDDVRS